MRFVETDKVELKEKISDSLPKEIESFLNTEGGVLYIGINDDGDVVGVENIDSTLRSISDILSDQIEPNAIDCVKPEVEFVGSNAIIKINIKKGYSSLYCIKKYGFSSNGCHYRVGTTCKSMTLEMIKKRFEAGLSSLDMMVRRESYYSEMRFTKFKMLLIENGYHLEENSFERNFKLRTNDGSYNYLAELLSDENSIPFIFAKFKGKTKATFSERSDYGNQCIILAYERMKERLKLENVCKTITNPRPRRDIYLYDMDAVNEALVNAIIHNDYRITDPQVAYFDDRLEIISHGGLPNGLTKEEFFNGVSKPRNEQLMDIFTRLGIVEHTGHGIPVIVEKYGKSAFEISESYIRVTIPFDREVILNHGAISGAISGVNRDELEAKEKIILSEIETNPNLSTRELSENLNIPFRSVQRYISNLREKGFIERVGANKNGYWKVIK